MFSRKLRSWKTKFESQNCCNCRSLKPSISLCMTVVLLICCCHDNRHKMPLSSCGEGGLKDQTGGEYMGEGLWACFLEKNLCHYKVATGLIFTAAYSPYSSTGPWSPCRLNVEQHHDWDATSIHSPPLQRLWLTAQHTLFNPRKRAPRLDWKPAFLGECDCSAADELPWTSSVCGAFMIACTVVVMLAQSVKPSRDCGMVFWTGTGARCQ